MSSSFLSQSEIEKLLSRLDQEAASEVLAERAAWQDAVETSPARLQAGEAKEIERVRFPELKDAKTQGRHSLQLFWDIPVTLSLELGAAEMTVREVLALQKNSVIRLNKLAGENVTLLVNGTPLATGEVVVINDNFGFRLAALSGDGARQSGEKE